MAGKQPLDRGRERGNRWCPWADLKCGARSRSAATVGASPLFSFHPDLTLDKNANSPSKDGKMVSDHMYIYVVSGIIVMVAVLFAISTVYMDYNIRVKTVEQQTYCVPGPACPDGWVGYQGECYNFPDVKKDWPSSQKACSFENASLLTFSHDEEKEFVMRYLYKGTTWLGLSKDPDQLWGWTNGENSTVPKVNGEGDCVYLNKDGNATAAKCTTELYWICNKPDIFNR